MKGIIDDTMNIIINQNKGSWCLTWPELTCAAILGFIVLSLIIDHRQHLAENWVLKNNKKQMEPQTKYNSLIGVAGPTGFEPATSGLTGQRSDQAELRPRLNQMVGGTGFEPVTPCL